MALSQTRQTLAQQHTAEVRHMTTLRKLCKDTTEVTPKMTADLVLDDKTLCISWGDRRVWIDRPPNLGREHREVLAAFLGLSRVPGDPEIVAGEDGPGYLITPNGGASVSHHVAPEDVLGVLAEIEGLASVEPKALAGQPVETCPSGYVEYGQHGEHGEHGELGVDIILMVGESSVAGRSTKVMLGVSGEAHLPPGRTLKIAYHLLALLRAQRHSLNEADYDYYGQPLTQPQ